MYPRYHLLVYTLVIAAACGSSAPVPLPVAAAPPEPATPPEPARPFEPRTPLEAAVIPEPATSPAAPKPTEVAAPSTPSAATNDVSNPWGPPANETATARAARLDVRDRLARGCRGYLTTADVKAICGSKIRSVDSSRAGERPPACGRNARGASDFYPLRLTIDNEASAPRTVVAMSAQDRAQAQSLDLGDASLIYYGHLGAQVLAGRVDRVRYDDRVVGRHRPR